MIEFCAACDIKMRKINNSIVLFFEKSEKFKGEDGWLFGTKADYINKLLRILEDKSENWENALQNEIAEAEIITLRMFGMKV